MKMLMSNFVMRNVRNLGKISYLQLLNLQTYATTIEKQLLNMEHELKKGMNVSISDELEHLESIDTKWASQLKGQKLLSSIMHNLVSQKKNKEVNLIVQHLKSVKYEMWGGMSSVVLKNHIALHSWNDAIQHFEEMKEKNHVKHLRSYKELVMALAANDRLQEACKYFQEMGHEELASGTSRLKQPDLNMVSYLLTALVETDQKRLNSVKVCESKTSVDYSLKLMYSVLEYLESWDVQLTPHTTDLMLQWFRMRNEFHVIVTRMKHTSCENCSKNLTTSSESFADLCENIVESFETSNYKTTKEIRHLYDLVERKKNFHVLIDAGNLLYRGSRKKEKKLSPDLLKETLLALNRYCTKSFFNVALVFPQSLSKAEKLEQFDFIDENAKRNLFQYDLNVIALRNVNDDVVMCYLAAKSELSLRGKGETPVIVSNDSFYNNKFIVDIENRYLFFRWLRQRKSQVFDDDGSQVHYKASVNKVDAVHLIGSDGTVNCILKHT